MSRRVALQPVAAPAPRNVSFSFPAPGQLPSQVRWQRIMQGLEARHVAKKRKSSKPHRLSPKAARRAQIRSARQVEASFLHETPRRPAAHARVKTTRRTKKQRQGYQKRETARDDQKDQEQHVAKDTDGVDARISQSNLFVAVLSQSVDVIQFGVACPRGQVKSGHLHIS